MLPDGIEPIICDLFEAECFDHVFDDRYYGAENCSDCYPGCKATLLDYKQFKCNDFIYTYLESLLFQFSNFLDDSDVSSCDELDSEQYKYTKSAVEAANLVPVLETMTLTNMSENNAIEYHLKSAAIFGNVSGLCKYMMGKHWTSAMFQLPSANALRLYQDVKVTFSDKIATFGKKIS